MAKAGAKSKYETCVKPHLKEINDSVRKGIVEAEIAKSLGVSVASLNNYKQKYPELREALNKNKGADVLQDLINAGIEAAKGYFKENETVTVSIDENGNPTKRQKVTTKVWYPPNPVLHKFYVLNFGKDQGLVNDPLEYELRKARQEFEKVEHKEKNWELYLDGDAEDDK